MQLSVTSNNKITDSQISNSAILHPHAEFLSKSILQENKVCYECSNKNSILSIVCKMHQDYEKFCSIACLTKHEKKEYSNADIVIKY